LSHKDCPRWQSLFRFCGGRSPEWGYHATGFAAPNCRLKNHGNQHSGGTWPNCEKSSSANRLASQLCACGGINVPVPAEIVNNMDLNEQM
jgi:hypothetical protein